MRASNILLRLWLRGCTRTAPKRLAVMMAAVDAIFRSSQITLTAIGRALASSALVKHRIKRMDRLLGNTRVLSDLPTLQHGLACRLLRRERHPVVLLDWTQLHGDWWVLCAALPFVGRAIPIYYEVHDHSFIKNARVESRFLGRLKLILPVGARPVIVADAGFQTPFFTACVRVGFDFVIRLRGAGVMRPMYEPRRLSFIEAHSKATAVAQCLGNWVPYKSTLHREYRIILGQKPGISPTRHDAYRVRATEPWLLATTLRRELPSQIVATYALRMQIEETFRDAKNPHFGWALEHTQSRSIGRLTILVALTAFALTAAVLIGVAAEDANLHKSLQANTCKRRVLSVTFLGRHFGSEPSHLRLKQVLDATRRAREQLSPLAIAKPLQLRFDFPRQHRRPPTRAS